jgi:hypothetical protein
VRHLALPLALALLAAGVAGCSNYSGDLANRIGQWATGATYDADNSQILSDLGNLSAGYSERQLLPLRTACEAFGVDVDALYGTLPTPDATLTNELNDALTTFGAASVKCYASASFSSPSFRSYLAELARGKALYAKARQRLLSFGIR